MTAKTLMIQGTASDAGKSMLVADLARRLLQLDDGSDGALSADGQIAGMTLHGLFDTAAGCDAILAWAGLNAAGWVDQSERRETSLERLADVIAGAIDLDALP